MTGRSVLVTGCSSGVGHRTAERLHTAGRQTLLTLRRGGTRAAMLGDAEQERPVGGGDAVAATVERFLSWRRMPPVSTVRGDARLLLTVERLLPAACSDALFRRLFTLVFRTPETP
jgi:NAD(P)-dependent dehydrogenase (short-subunit alcohol dehydrogenase family)